MQLIFISIFPIFSETLLQKKGSHTKKTLEAFGDGNYAFLKSEIEHLIVSQKRKIGKSLLESYVKKRCTFHLFKVQK